MASIDDLTTVMTFSLPWEAHDARARLEDAGVPAFVNNEASGTWLNHLGANIAGIEVVVRRRDLASARAILEGASPDGSTPLPLDDEWDDGDVEGAALAGGGGAGRQSGGKRDVSAWDSAQLLTQDELAQRAWGAAWLTFVLPLIMHACAIYQLATVRRGRGELSASGAARVSRAWLILICSVLLHGLVFAAFGGIDA